MWSLWGMLSRPCPGPLYQPVHPFPSCYGRWLLRAHGSILLWWLLLANGSCPTRRCLESYTRSGGGPRPRLTNRVGFEAQLSGLKEGQTTVGKKMPWSLWDRAAVRPLLQAHICLASSQLCPASLTSLQISPQGPPSHTRKHICCLQLLLANPTQASRSGLPSSLWDVGRGGTVRQPGKSWG